MDHPTIKKGWLTISNSDKREFKRKKKVTKRGRTPVGDKGVGRLGTQRLGYNLEIFTQPENSKVEYQVAFSWSDVLKASQFYRVLVHIKELSPPTRNKGTK